MSDMSDDDAARSSLYMSAEAIAQRDVVQRAISDYLQIIRPDDGPFITAWVVGVEWTNAELEQTGRAGRDTISPNEQTISASVGLGQYVVNRYS